MSVYTAICDYDLISKFQQPLESGKYMIAPEDGSIWNTQEYKENYGIAFDRVWHYINNPPNALCDWYHDIVALFGFIPTRCLGCWKVVVRPQNLQQLFLLQALMIEMSEKDPECYCKCGIEVRAFVFGNYGGYFYQTSKEAMQERYLQVRELVNEKISPLVDVIPKRYCSEFERQFGPSDQYKQPANAAHWEEAIKEGCHMVPFPYDQPDKVVRKVMREWIKHAWSIGDPTVNIYTDNVPLSPPVVRYLPEHKEETRGESQE